MDINLLKTYLEVVRTRHFKRAAGNLCITQSAVSSRIKLLESLLGVELFTRGRNNIGLTAAGERLRRHAETVVRGWERARLEVGLDPEMSASLALGCTPDLWKIRVAAWTKGIVEDHQEVALRLELLSYRHLTERLNEGTLDAIVSTTPRYDGGFDSIHLAEYRLIPYSTTADADLEQLMEDGGYILVDWGEDFIARHSEHFRHINPPRIQSTSCIAALDLLRKTGGAAYIAEPMARDLAAENRLFRIPDAPSFGQSMYLVFKSEVVERKALRWITDPEGK